MRNLQTLVLGVAENPNTIKTYTLSSMRLLVKEDETKHKYPQFNMHVINLTERYKPLCYNVL